jgi:hypothetical protein
MVVKAVAEALVGALIVVGATAAWHFWEVDGVLAVAVAFVGLVMMCHAFDTK